MLDAVASGRPFLGVCVGTQMLFDASEEDAATRGLGVIPGVVRWLPAGVKRPQMQWNRVDVADARRRRCSPASASGRGSTSSTRCTASPTTRRPSSRTCDYGGPVNAAFRRGNVFATQFHPEKSAAAGLGLLGNFVASLRVAA